MIKRVLADWICKSRASIAAAVLSVLFVCSGCGPDPDPDPDHPDHDLTVTEVIERVEPSMVNIETDTGSGSGVIFSKDGYIITNDHVIRDTKTVEVHIANHKLDAKKIGTDRRRDIAVLKVEEKDLRPAAFADSDNAQKGADVVAIGNSLGLHDTVKKGAISNVNIVIDNGAKKNKYIQTDAQINHGNSGGGLVNMRAEVVGINVMGLSSDVGEGVNFAVPANEAKKTAEQLIDKGYVEYPYIGVECSNEKNKKNGSYVLVVNVESDSPAAQEGIRRGDIILEANGASIKTVSELREQIETSGAGGKVTIKISRTVNGKSVQGKAQIIPKMLRTGFYQNDWS